MTRVTTPVTCDWLVEVASGNPEPDFPSDCFVIVPCGARVRRHPDYPGTHATICDHGHDRLPGEIEFAAYGPAWQRDQADRYAEMGNLG